MTDHKLLVRARQVAVIGSSGDIATTEELALAEACGFEIARRGLGLATGGDDGVMGAAARAAKSQGGTTLAVVPRDKHLVDTWPFDSVVDTGLTWVQFSDVLFRSCCGALIIGGGAGTLGELAVLYLQQLPAAFVGAGPLAAQFGGRPLDSRGLAVFRTFDTPTTALDYIVARFGETLEASRADGPATATVPEYLAREGWNLQLQSYPYGTADAYLAAAEYFREAAALYSSPGTHWGSAEANHWQQAMAHWHDALGDHFYYKVEDFLQAATHYTRALGYAESDTSRNQATQAFAAYLRAIMLESIAFGLVKSGEIRLAKVVVEEAARRYEAAVAVSPSSDHPYLKHSSTGLQGEARYFHALACFQDGHLAEARAAVADAKALYQHALQWSPRWGEGCSSDNYARVMARVAQLEAQLGEAEEAGS